MEEVTTQPSEEDSVPKDITFHYIKSNFFRVIRVDGAYGGLSPHGDIHMAVYNQRQPIPVQTTNLITPDGKLGDESGKVAREGIVREVEADINCSPHVARTIAKWLIEKADMAEKLAREAKVDG